MYNLVIYVEKEQKMLSPVTKVIWIWINLFIIFIFVKNGYSHFLVNLGYICL